MHRLNRVSGVKLIKKCNENCTTATTGVNPFIQFEKTYLICQQCTKHSLRYQYGMINMIYLSADSLFSSHFLVKFSSEFYYCWFATIAFNLNKNLKLFKCRSKKNINIIVIETFNRSHQLKMVTADRAPVFEISMSRFIYEWMSFTIA